MDEPSVEQPQPTTTNSNLMDDFLAAYETLEQEQKNKEKLKFLGLTSNVGFSAEDVDMRTRLGLAANSSTSSGSVKDGIKKKESKHRRSKSESKKDADNEKTSKSKSKKKKKSKEATSETDSPASEDSDDEEEEWFDPSTPVSDPVLFVVPLKNPKSDFTEHQILLYRGQDNHIHYMYSLDDEEWKHIDLTLKVSAPGAMGDPSGYYRTVGNNIARYIVYKGEDDCLHQISSKDDGKKWTYRNLSKISLQFQPKPAEKFPVTRTPTPTELPPLTMSTTNNPVPATPEKKNTITEVFRVAATVGDISSVANVKADMSLTVQELVQKVMSRFPKDVDQDNYFLLANTKNGPKWLMEIQKHLFEYADILVDVQYQLELRKLSKNSMIRAKNPETSPLVDKRKGSKTMRLSFTEAKSLQF